jgi:hypothetical protein
MELIEGKFYKTNGKLKEFVKEEAQARRLAVSQNKKRIQSVLGRNNDIIGYLI